ncbi:MAG: transcriptional regulator [Flavobacteriaceae bacterium CG_4_8_14_3_um_filter_34_10]|nr:Rrf2 family transcriptional regulator [Flavobacteriia bacterium]OIP51415.1 MAG: transcriptional regulator [Flavobacteriaceae bacterium CG2_30_34_30]PIQ17894.1 MAG: transcriptional regulator [Flavobacteriaceae bacterium CG18_big_fil_WC_8_21_14_2_50_34_36]PIV51807.1 MAG: transcriptional regulator [Flavobacteriaceae bacterium CG02_land_8_20_14_3_00_34_13]PIX10199.1 MAG: transcriptional regulator [Flavobacteriaceae bacterium CG_4_8_14_3_um_filter_34_10]PIZ08905.1 MAG: transcriptional regulator 
MFSKACEYGIKATLHIAEQSLQKKRIVLPEIAKAIDSPVAFTAKILQQLAKNKIVQSSKGPNGGFSISAEAMETFKLKDIVIAIDGDAIFTECGLGLKKCDENSPCPIHHKFKSIRAEIIDMLETTSLKYLSKQLESGTTFLKI